MLLYSIDNSNFNAFDHELVIDLLQIIYKNINNPNLKKVVNICIGHNLTLAELNLMKEFL
jgi:hypothetical protein